MIEKINSLSNGRLNLLVSFKKKKACTGLNQSLISTKFFKLINVARCIPRRNRPVDVYCYTVRHTCNVLVIRVVVLKKKSINLKWALSHFNKLTSALNGYPLRNLKVFKMVEILVAVALLSFVLCLTQKCRDLKRQNFIKQAP